MEGDHNRHHFTQAHSRSIEARLLSPHQQGLLAIVIIKGMNPRGKPRLVFRPKGRGMNPKRFKGLLEIVYLAENFGNIKMIIHIHGWYLGGGTPSA